MSIPNSLLPPLDADLLDRVLAGHGTADEEAHVRAWASSHPERQHLYGALTHLTSAGPQAAALPDVEHAWTRWKTARDTDPTRQPRAARGRALSGSVRQRSWRWGWGSAMAFGLILLLAYVVRPERASNVAISAGAQTSKTYTTQYAQRMTIDLRDGSRVILAPNTQLRYTIDGNGVTKIDLDGQAYFAVTPKPTRPFLVKTAGVTTRVLGTEFDVRHYAGDRSVQVAVVTGKVAVHTLGAQTVLTAGTLGLATDSSTVTTPMPDASAVVGWTNDQLQFTRASTSEVLETVGRWYGYEFRIADSSLMSARLTTVLFVSKPEETIRVLQTLLDATMTFDAKHQVVVVRSRRSTRQSTTPPARSGGRDTFPTPSTEVGR